MKKLPLYIKYEPGFKTEPDKEIIGLFTFDEIMSFQFDKKQIIADDFIPYKLYEKGIKMYYRFHGIEFRLSPNWNRIKLTLFKNNW